MLAARFRELLDAGVVAREANGRGPSYHLTESGLELAGTVRELGTWGQRWLPRELRADHLDTSVLVWDMRRRVNLEALPPIPILMRIETSVPNQRPAVHFLLLRKTEVSLCSANPGFPEALQVRAPLRALTGWWRGDFSLADARSAGMVIEGRREWVRAFPRWFERYAFAEVPARAE